MLPTNPWSYETRVRVRVTVRVTWFFSDHLQVDLLMRLDTHHKLVLVVRTQNRVHFGLKADSDFCHSFVQPLAREVKVKVRVKGVKGPSDDG